MSITPEQEMNAIDMVATATIDEIAADTHTDPSVTVAQFLASRTGRMLYDPSLKMWWQGPSDLACEYYREQNGKKC